MVQQSMTPSVKVVTEDQIEKAVEVLRAKLRKHRDQLPSEAVQEVLGQEQTAHDLFAAFRIRVEAVSSMIVRRVRVDRTRTPQETLAATGRRQYTNADVVAGMPRGEGEEVDVYLFKVDWRVSDDGLDGEYASRGFVPADPYTLAAVNEADPAFADQHPNGTHWKDVSDRWCVAAFGQWRGDERCVVVGRGGGGWYDVWWFAGVRK